MSETEQEIKPFDIERSTTLLKHVLAEQGLSEKRLEEAVSQEQDPAKKGALLADWLSHEGDLDKMFAEWLGLCARLSYVLRIHLALGASLQSCIRLAGLFFWRAAAVFRDIETSLLADEKEKNGGLVVPGSSGILKPGDPGFGMGGGRA